MRGVKIGHAMGILEKEEGHTGQPVHPGLKGRGLRIGGGKNEHFMPQPG